MYAAVFRHRCAHHPLFIEKEQEADNGLPADVKAEAARKAEERLKVHDLLLHYAPLPAGVHPELF